MKTESDARKRTLGCAYYALGDTVRMGAGGEEEGIGLPAEVPAEVATAKRRKIGEWPRQPRRRRRLVGGDDGEEETRYRTVGRTICVNYCVVLLRW